MYSGYFCGSGHSLSGRLPRPQKKDAIDTAVIDGLKKNQSNGYQLIHFVPFNAVNKRTEATIKGPDGKQFYVAMGASQVISEWQAMPTILRPMSRKR